MKAVFVLISALLAAAGLSHRAQADERSLTFGRFGNVVVYSPTSPPSSVALFVSGDGGWNAGVVAMARTLVTAGALVVGIDIRTYLASVARTRQECVYFAADFEELSHAIQKRYGLTRYLVPVAVGYSSGATLVYALLAQAPGGMLAGGLSLGFSPELAIDQPVCRSNALEYSTGHPGEFVLEPAASLQTPWVALQGEVDQVVSPAVTAAYVERTPLAALVSLPRVGHGYGRPADWEPQFRASYARLAGGTEPHVFGAGHVADLPLVEVPAQTTRGNAAHDVAAVLLTGDGGWAGLDRDVSAALAAHGIPVLGFNSLKYFWQARTPSETADAVARAAHHALERFGKSRVMFVGYSFGADVLPFALTRLPAELVARTSSISLLAPSLHADFEIRVSGWLPGIGPQGDERPVAPEIARLPSAIPKQCIRGHGENDDPCAALPDGSVRRVEVGSGHHFSGDVAAIVSHLMQITADGR